MKTLTLLLGLILCVPALSQEKVAISIEAVTDLKKAGAPKSYLIMLEDFARAGGKGRTFHVKTEDQEAAGFYLAVDQLPKQRSKKSISLVTRDKNILEHLKNLKTQDVPIFLHSIDKKIDAAVLGDDDFGGALRKKAFPKSSKNYSLSVSPSTTQDILLHEMAHVKHKDPSHPLEKFLSTQKSQLSPTQFAKTKRTLTELYAYQEQYEFLEDQRRKGKETILTLSKNPPDHKVEVSDFNEYYEGRIREIQAAAGMYMNSLSADLRKMQQGTQCAVIDQVRNAIAGMGDIETNLVEDHLHFQRCTAETNDSKTPNSGVR